MVGSTRLIWGSNGCWRARYGFAMPAQRTTANGIELAYETFGEDGRPPVLLVMGLGAQMIGWHDDFCAMLAHGRHVVRFDNRDVGESQWLEGQVDLVACMAGDTSSAVYTLEDMADDVAGLLDALGLDSAHVVGASMGGMVAQTLAIRHPERVRSITSIMSTTGELGVAQPTEAATEALLSPPARSRDEAMERAVAVNRVIGSPGHPADARDLRERAARGWDRGLNPSGFARQLAAIHASGDRTAALASVTAPTLVVHGEDDPLVPVSGGRATAAAIPGAELLVVPGMGHDLPRALWPDLIARIGAHVDSAELAYVA
jgi:pimeloyl-ACP methyl ester carboxylesterase